MAKRKPDLFETFSDDELLRQVFENPPEAPAHQQAMFLLNYRLARRQARFNQVVTIATVVMAIQAVLSIVELVLNR